MLCNKQEGCGAWTWGSQTAVPGLPPVILLSLIPRISLSLSIYINIYSLSLYIYIYNIIILII